MIRFERIGVIGAMLLFAAPAFCSDIYITGWQGLSGVDFSGRLINLQALYPDALFSDTAAFDASGASVSPGTGVTHKFDLTPINSVNYGVVENFLQINTSNISAPTAVYMLINMFASVSAQNAFSVVFNGNNGTVQAFAIINNGSNVREYFWNDSSGASIAKTINTATSPTNTVNVECHGSNAPANCGAAVTGKGDPTNLSGANVTGTFVLDEQRFLLDNAGWATDTLKNIQFFVNSSGGFGVPIIAGITADGTPPPPPPPTPEPGTIAMAIGGVALIWVGRKRATR